MGTRRLRIVEAMAIMAIAVIVGLAFSLPLDSVHAASKSKNAYAKSIKTSVGKLSPKFAKNKTAYVVNLTENQESTKLTFAKADKKAKARVKVGNAKWSKYSSKATLAKTVKVTQGKSVKVQFTVKAQSGKTKTYKVTVKRATPAVTVPETPVATPEQPTTTPETPSQTTPPASNDTPSTDPTPAEQDIIRWDATATEGLGNFKVNPDKWQVEWKLYYWVSKEYKPDSTETWVMIPMNDVTGELFTNFHLYTSNTQIKFKIRKYFDENLEQWVYSEEFVLIRP